ncbi:hypothetical protein B4123_1702 [Bacillus paralicheniformis]|nr:hypothetical protein B4123_1702 [Bacillus paralicheniformis]TWJ49514.1 hypothetical protein CHCC5023_1697 [Bacillus paralicheniformis]TWJ74306.1 hypothetical protein CHCC20497_3391 [Bacillus paralicheniformis]TWJ77468.1 hypothetical protein CHCC5019_2944 [Bacillus paralicheniformis]TWK45390.1 hypothetical protein CHCC20348_3038 [Bacillus paralicheniformis]
MTKSQNKKSFWDFVNNLKAAIVCCLFYFVKHAASKCE